MNEETTPTSSLSEMTREQIEMEIASIDQIAKQNSFKYEKRMRGDFPDGKWDRFIASQNEMFGRRAMLEEELEARDTGDDESEDDQEGQESQTVVYDFSGMSAAEVLRSLSYRPTKDELHQACDWLGISYTPTMTNAELKSLIEAMVDAESGE